MNYQPLLMAVVLTLVMSPFQANAQEQVKPVSYDEIMQSVYESTAEADDVAKSVAKNAANKNAKSKVNPGPKPILDWDIYRDNNSLPVDPRKPCNPCTKRKGCDCCQCGLHDHYGYKGRPYQEREPGGCLCGRKHERKKRRPFFSIYWPSVNNALCEEYHPERAARRNNPNRCRLSSLFDHLGGFELMPCYERPDTGYSGPWRDRYGCVGESKYFNTLDSQVFGVDYRVPGQAVNPGNVIEYP